nr:putative ribonuclease H-like domain-containing protein [Tanacetum cinerariifolium]
MANVSKPISIPNEEFSDGTTPCVARKFLNEVKSTIVTLQCVVKHRMTLETHNWSFSAHQELHKISKDENFPIVNQVDARVQKFEIHFLKEAAKFVGDFKSLAKEADESLAKHKALELEIERLLRAVNDWSKKCEECKFDKISYDKAYNDMQQKIERLQAQLGDLKGIDNTKTRMPQPRSNTKNDRVLFASKSSCNKNKGVEVEEHHRNLLLSKKKKHMSSTCNNIKFDYQNVKSKVVYAMCKQCLISVNQDVCLLNYVNGKTSRGQSCDSDLEVAFRRNACFVRNLEGVDLLKGNRSTNLYTINLHEMASASPICLMARASSIKSWLWLQRLSHLNFDTINDLAKHDLVSGLPKFKYHKEHLCSSCEQGKSKRASHPPKHVPNFRQRLHLLHMDLCGPMSIASINGKRYVLVIMDDYSRYTWVQFLRSKDEAPDLVSKTDLICLTKRTMFHGRLVFSGDPNREVPVNETFHVQTDDELTEKELKHIEADDQAIQTILLGLPKDIYAAVDSCETAQESWFISNDGESIESYYHRFLKLMNDLKRNKHFPEKIATDYTQLYDFLKYNQKEVDELKAERLAKIQDPLALMATSNNPYTFPVLHQDQPSFDQNYMQQPMPNPEDITDPTTAMDMALALMAKAFKLNYSTPINNNYRISSNPRNRHIAQPGMNMGQDKHMQMVRGNGENQVRQYVGQNVGNLNGGVGHFARNCTVKPRRNDAACLQTQLLIAQKEEAGIQLQAEYKHRHRVLRLTKLPSMTQTDQLRVQKFEIQFLKEAAKFVGDFKSLAKEADESLAKHKALELEIERLLRAVENEYAKLWNDWSKKCEECKFDKISYDKAYNDMQQKIERLQAHLKTTYKNLFDSISVSRTLTKTIIDSLQNKLHNTIYENAKLRAQLFNKVSDQKDNTHGTSANTKFAKQSIVGNLPKIGETHALSKPVTSNLIPTPQESKVVKNDKVIAPGMFRINPFKTSREENHVPNKVRASVRTKPITISQPTVFTKKDVNSNSNGLSSTGIDNTKTRRPQPRSNTKNDRVPFASKSSCNKNKGVEVEERHRNLLLSKKKKHMSSTCNNIKFDYQNVKSKVVYAMCKQCLISVNHDVCLLNYVNGKTSRGKKQKSKVKKPKKVGFIERLATPKPSHNLFSVGQFCDSNLEVAFRRNACFVRNLEGVDLLKGNRSTNLYTINLHEMASASPICLMARASSTKSWLWHQRLSHLNFDTINDLAKHDLVSSLPKFKYHKEHLCSSCEQGKIKRASHPPKPVPNSRQRLHLLHMDLCGPMRIASTNGKRYVLVIVDDYSRYTWVQFLRSKDEAPKVIKTFLKRISILLQSPVIIIRTKNGTEFKNKVLKEYFDSVGIYHQVSS